MKTVNWLSKVVLAGCHLPTTETGTVQKQKHSRANAAAQDQAGQSSATQKTLAQCQPVTLVFWVAYVL